MCILKMVNWTNHITYQEGAVIYFTKREITYYN